MPATADWSVAVPVYNALAVTSRTVEYLLSSGVDPAAIGLWDDGSTDPEWERLSDWALAAGCGYQRHEENRGYTVNVNRIFRAARTSRVLLLNSDCLIGRQEIEAMVQVMARHPAVAAVDPLSNVAGYQSVALGAMRRWQDLEIDEIAAMTHALQERLA